MRLFHFSDEPNIKMFAPRPVRVPTDRGAGRQWLNGPLVWAIDAQHEPMYLFPRECPRILLWATPATTTEDRARWFGTSTARVVAYIEEAWLDRFTGSTIHRYELDPASFEDLHDAGMWVSHAPARPVDMTSLSDLPTELRLREVELRAVGALAPIRSAWRTSLHVSGIRLRNAAR